MLPLCVCLYCFYNIALLWLNPVASLWGTMTPLNIWMQPVFHEHNKDPFTIAHLDARGSEVGNLKLDTDRTLTFFVLCFQSSPGHSGEVQTILVGFRTESKTEQYTLLSEEKSDQTISLFSVIKLMRPTVLNVGDSGSGMCIPTLLADLLLNWLMVCYYICILYVIQQLFVWISFIKICFHALYVWPLTVYKCLHFLPRYKK